MIYTVGNTIQYEDLLALERPIQKTKGGSVWPSCLSALDYLYFTHQIEDFSVYGVTERWENTRQIDKRLSYRALRRDVPIVRVDDHEVDLAELYLGARRITMEFAAMTPWITRVEIDTEGRRNRQQICRFCLGKKPNHYTYRDYRGTQCIFISSQRLIHGIKKEERRKDHILASSRSGSDSSQVVQPSERPESSSSGEEAIRVGETSNGQELQSVTGRVLQESREHEPGQTSTSSSSNEEGGG